MNTLGKNERLSSKKDIARLLEEGIDCVPGGEDYRGIVQDVQPLCAELPGRQWFNEEKRPEIYLDTKLLGNGCIRCHIQRGSL